MSVHPCGTPAGMMMTSPAFTTLLTTSAPAIIPLHDLSREIAATIKKVKRTEILGGLDEETGRRTILGHTIEVELHDKAGPLKLLAQHLGLFTEAPRERKLGKDFAAILEAAGQRALDAAARQRVIEGVAEKVK